MRSITSLRLSLWVLLAALLLASGLAHAKPRLEIELSLDPQSGDFSASAILQPALRDFRFLLHESLQVVAVSAQGQAMPFAALAGPAGLRQWQTRLARAGEPIRIDYRGRLPPLDRQLDHRSVLQALPPMSSQAGSFLPAGSGWYPQEIDSLPAGSGEPEMFSYRVKLSLPGEQRAIVPGQRVAETLPVGPEYRYRATFEFRHPNDGIDLMAGPWIVREKLVEPAGAPRIVLRTYFSPALDATPGLAQAYLDDAARYLERYSREIGAYPYREFSIVAGPLPTGFAMPTLTYLGEAVVRLPFIRQTSLGHEVLHNWWGNGVHVDYAQGNWSEGLTTLMADYAYQEDQSAAAASAMRLAWLRDAMALPADEQPALAQFRSRTHGAQAAVGYGKAAMLFVMLRERIGAAVFRQAIREFWASKRFSVAAWEDLQAAFEKASGLQLGPFFAFWLQQRELPAIAVERAESSPRGQRYRLSLTLAQATPAAILHLPVEISAPGQREVRWLEIDSTLASAAFDLDFQPQSLRIDPEFRVWRRLEAQSLPPILRAWIGASAPLLYNVASSPASHAAVEALAQRFFERPLQATANLAEALRGSAPILLAGTHAEVDRALAAAGLPARPRSLAGRGSAQVWTMEALPQAPLAVVSADDEQALLALQRSLPHYGAQSWLIFAGTRLNDKGVWPATVPVIPVRQR